MLELLRARREPTIRDINVVNSAVEKVTLSTEGVRGSTPATSLPAPMVPPPFVSSPLRPSVPSPSAPPLPPLSFLPESPMPMPANLNGGRPSHCPQVSDLVNDFTANDWEDVAGSLPSLVLMTAGECKVAWKHQIGTSGLSRPPASVPWPTKLRPLAWFFCSSVPHFPLRQTPPASPPVLLPRSVWPLALFFISPPQVSQTRPFSCSSQHRRSKWASGPLRRTRGSSMLSKVVRQRQRQQLGCGCLSRVSLLSHLILPSLSYLNLPILDPESMCVFPRDFPRPQRLGSSSEQSRGPTHGGQLPPALPAGV